jgi:hypothetical protein
MRTNISSSISLRASMRRFSRCANAERSSSPSPRTCLAAQTVRNVSVCPPNDHRLSRSASQVSKSAEFEEAYVPERTVWVGHPSETWSSHERARTSVGASVTSSASSRASSERAARLDAMRALRASRSARPRRQPRLSSLPPDATRRVCIWKRTRSRGGEERERTEGRKRQGM